MFRKICKSTEKSVIWEFKITAFATMFKLFLWRYRKSARMIAEAVSMVEKASSIVAKPVIMKIAYFLPYLQFLSRNLIRDAQLLTSPKSCKHNRKSCKYDRKSCIYHDCIFYYHTFRFSLTWKNMQVGEKKILFEKFKSHIFADVE